MLNDHSNIYNQEYFLQFMEGEKNYQFLAAWLSENIAFETAVDFGCGNGALIKQLYALNKRILGIDFSPAAFELAPDTIKYFMVKKDLTKPFCFGKFELVISLETAEHLPESCSNKFVDDLVKHSSEVICFSAAVPGQGGEGHINEQASEYWLSLFSNHNYYLEKKLTEDFRDFLNKNACVWWYCNNVQIYTRCEALPCNEYLI